jgi:hypothetical protein
MGMAKAPVRRKMSNACPFALPEFFRSREVMLPQPSFCKNAENDMPEESFCFSGC